MNLDDTQVWSLLRLGFVLYSRERLEQAGAIFDGVVQLRPNLGYGWYGLGLVRREQADFRGAVECLNRSMNCPSTGWAQRVALAELLRVHGYAQDASAVLEPVVEAPDADDPMVRRARALWRAWRISDLTG